MAPLTTKMIFSLQSFNKFMTFSFFLSLFIFGLLQSTMSQILTETKAVPWQLAAWVLPRAAIPREPSSLTLGLSRARRGPKSRAREETEQASSHLFISTYNFWLYILPVPFLSH